MSGRPTRLGVILELKPHPASRRVLETLAWQGFGVLVAWQLVGNWAAGLLALYWHVHSPLTHQLRHRTLTLDLLTLREGWMNAQQLILRDRYGKRVSIYRDEVSAEQFAEVRRAIKATGS